MAKCNEELFELLSQKKISDTDEIELRLKRNLNDCRRISALSPVAVSGEYTPNKYDKPANAFECMRKGCVNTGLLMLSAANETATYKTPDSTEFSSGVVTFYVKPDEDAEYPVTVTFKIGNEEALTNADVYTATVTEDMVGDDGYAPVVILLSNAPDSTTGDGWTPSAAGSFIQVSADKVAGFSSFAILESVEDFELYDIIKMRCITNAGDDQSLSVLEEKCQDVEYDKNVNTIPFSVTAQLVSSNYMRGNPMYGKGTNTEGFVPSVIKKTVESYTVDDTEYGRVTLADANQKECARISVQYKDDCESVLLTALSIPTLMDVDEGHFLTIENEDGSTDLIFNKEHIGKEFLVSYPKTATIEESVFSTDFLDDAVGSLVWTKHLSDGTTIVDVFDNVFITTFPRNISDTTATFTWSFSIARDSNGNFYRSQKILA